MADIHSFSCWVNSAKTSIIVKVVENKDEGVIWKGANNLQYTDTLCTFQLGSSKWFQLLEKTWNG